MSEFFDGWRRKAGCMTLMMAAVVAGAWMRSMHCVDWIVLRPDNHTRYFLQSSHFGISWARVILPESSKQTCVWIEIDGLRHRYPVVRAIGDRSEGEWQADGSIPYWSLVLPLTLLSAYLIHWPVKRKAGELALTIPTIHRNLSTSMDRFRGGTGNGLGSPVP